MVQRSGTDVHVAGAVVPLTLLARGLTRCRPRARLAIDALRASGRARGVEHCLAQLGVVDVVPLLRRQRLLVRVEAVDGSADGQQDPRARCQRGRLLGAVGEADVGDERLGLAVPDDVAGFLPGEVPVDRCEAEPGAEDGADHLGELGPVGADESHGVARVETSRAKGAHQLVGARVELGVGEASGVGHDGGTVGRRLRVDGGGHPTREQPQPLGVDLWLWRFLLLGRRRRFGHPTGSLPSFSMPGSLGRPRALSPTMLRWISAVPPQIVLDRDPR